MARASDIMQEKIVTMPKKKGLKGVIDIILNTEADYVIITEKDKAIGILTEKDLLRRILFAMKSRPRMKLDEIMTKNVISISSDTDVKDICNLMEKDNIRHLPVIDDGILHGVITAHDLIRETGEIEGSNKMFLKYQNIQTAIIIVFFLFLLIFLLLRYYSTHA